MIKTIKLRIKDSNTKKHLKKMSRAVNYVWNYCNETSFKALRDDSKWINGFQLQRLTAGSSIYLGLPSSAIQELCVKYAKRRFDSKKKKLRWRGGRSLGWIPFKSQSLLFKKDHFVFNKLVIKVFETERIPVKGTYGAGEFSEDSRGRWYLCISVDVEEEITTAKGEVGIDLGLKTIASMSNGQKIENKRNYRLLEKRLKKAQQSKKKRLVKTIHAKIKNQRADYLHKASTKIVKENQLIVVGDLKIAKMTKTKMAKSTYDAGLSMFKTMLKYKASAHKRWYVEVNETNTTRTCSVCENIPDSSPRGVKGLSIREWTCSLCGAVLDRDHNAAINILRLGKQTLVPEVAQELKAQVLGVFI